MRTISTRISVLAFTCLLIICTSLSFSANAQVTRTVCAGGCDFTTIQAAINASSTGDVILINVSGTHTEKNIVLPEKSLTIKGLGKSTTILQSAAARASVSGGRIFSYAAPAGAGNNQFTFEDMTIRHAYAPLTETVPGYWQSAGAVFLATGTLKGLKLNMNRVRFYANETTGGNNINSGGACFYLSATGTGFTYNADITVEDCDFDDNRVANSAGTSLSDGTCFDLLGSPNRITINNSRFTGNNGYTRGGVMYVGANWTIAIRNSVFDGNTARNGDGGCFSVRSAQSITIDNCLFKNNSAVYQFPVNGTNGYAGVMITKGAKIRNSTFYNNSAVKGGAILRVSSTAGDELQLINCTFYGNQASSTGKTIQYGTGNSAISYPLVMVNTIIANGGGSAPSEINFTLPYTNFTINSRNYCNSISTDNATPGTTPTFQYHSGNSSLNISSTLADNGGLTQTLALAANSSLRDAGLCTTGSTYEIPVKDQRNYARTDGNIDLGAMEYNGIADDPAAPTIAYTALTSTMSTGDRVITATIADANGVFWYPQFTDNRPRIYFRKNNGTWQSGAGTWTGGSGVNGTWDFTIAAAAMGGVVNGDQIHYYIIAQDVSTVPGIHSVPAGVVAASVNGIITAPVPHSYLIGSTLPVKLESFQVLQQGRTAQLTWKVSEEDNFSHYEVERSVNGQQWSVLGKVFATGLREYRYLDNTLEQGIYYYRLRCVDRDGKFSFSSIRRVSLDNAGTTRVYPNPVTGGKFNIQVENAATAVIYNNAGVLVMQKQLAAGITEIHVANLPAGSYQVLIEGKNYAVIIQK